MFEIPQGALMAQSTFWPLNKSKNYHIYLELLEDNDIDALRTIGVHPILNRFWQFPLCNL